MLTTNELMNYIDTLTEFTEPVLKRELKHTEVLNFVVDVCLCQLYQNSDEELIDYIREAALKCLCVSDYCWNSNFWVLEWL